MSKKHQNRHDIFNLLQLDGEAIVEKTSTYLLTKISQIRIKDPRRNYQHDLNTITIK